MDFHLPALTRYLVETGVTSPTGTDRGSQRDLKEASEVTRFLSEQLLTTNPPSRLPKAVEAYIVGPSARGYQPIDADAQYIVPFNKSPQRSPVLNTPEPDPDGDLGVRPVGRSSPPLALGPPRHSSLQSGQIASIINAAANTDPLDWSFLFGSPLPASPQYPGARSSMLPASVATFIRPVKVGSNSVIGNIQLAGTVGKGSGAVGAAAITAASASAGSDPAGLSQTGKKSGLMGQGQFRKQAAASETGTGILGRRVNPTVAAMPQTPEAKFCSAVMNVMERLAATQSIQTGRYRSLRLQAAEHREAIISTVTMPPPPKTGAFSSQAANNRMTAVLQRSGANLDDMQAIVKQIQQFKGLSDDLRTAVAQQFQVFSYPPGSYLYEQDCTCDEAFVLISGTVMLHTDGRPPHRLQAGTVLGVELMLRRHPVPLSVTTDPHFEAQLAVLSWNAYETTVRRWAADKVCALMPELQTSQISRLKAGLMRGISYAQRQPGEALYVGSQPTEHVVLLVQGQVLLAAPLEANTLVTQAQMVSQLRVMMGPAANAMVLNEMPRAATRGGLRGGLKSAQRPSFGPSGSVRLSGDSGGEMGGASGSGSGGTAGNGDSSVTAEIGGSNSIRRRGSDSGAGLALKKGVVVSPWQVPGEEEGEGSAGEQPQQQRHVSLVRALRNSTGRNSRHAAAAAAAAAGSAGVETDTAPAPPLATAVVLEDSIPSVSSKSRGEESAAVADGASGADADIASGPDGVEGEPVAERNREVGESTAAAASRLSRTSLQFGDANNAVDADVVEAQNDIDTGMEAGVTETDARVENAPQGPPDSTDPPVSRTTDGSQPAPVYQQPESVVPEPSLLPVVSAFDLATYPHEAVHNVHEPSSPVERLGPTIKSGGMAEATSFGPGLVQLKGSREGFAFAADNTNVSAEHSADSLKSDLPRHSAAAATAPSEEQPPGEGEDGPPTQGAAAEPEASAEAGLHSSDSSGFRAVEAIPATVEDAVETETKSFSDMGSTNLEAACGALQDGSEGSSAIAVESAPVQAAAASSTTSTPAPTPKSGLRSKIGGVPAHLQQSVSRSGSRGAPGAASSPSSPRSTSITRADSSKTPPTAANGRSTNSSRTDDSPAPSRSSLRLSSLVASPEGRTIVRPISQGMQSEGPGRQRRPSSPTSEAPSVDERRPESTSLLVHPILPTPGSSKLRFPDSDEEGAAPNGMSAVITVTTVPAHGGRLNVEVRQRGGDGAARSSSETYDADLARASTEGMPPTPPAQDMRQKQALVLAAMKLQEQQPEAMLAVAAPQQQRQLPPPSAPANGARVSSSTPDPDVDYSIARVSGGAMPGTESAKHGGAAGSRTGHSGRPGRNAGIARTHLQHGPRGGGGGVARKQNDTGRMWPYNGSPGASASGGGGGGAPGTAGGASQPLANALASQCKLHQHRVVAVYGAPVVFCEEALSEQKDSDTMKPTNPLAANSAVALQRCEYILIPAVLLRSLLSSETLPQLLEAAVAAQRRLITASGHTEDNGPMTWPAAADKIRDILSTSTPGHRQPWQVELLASAFSHLPAFSRLTWQVRLRVFQDLEYRKLDPGDHVDLTKLDVRELSWRPSEMGHRKSSMTAEGGIDVRRGSSASGNASAKLPMAAVLTPPAALTPRDDDGAAADNSATATVNAPTSIATKATNGDAAAAAVATEPGASVRYAAGGIPRVSEAPSSLPSRSPSYAGETPEASWPRWSSGADVAAKTAGHTPTGSVDVAAAAATVAAAAEKETNVNGDSQVVVPPLTLERLNPTHEPMDESMPPMQYSVRPQADAAAGPASAAAPAIAVGGTGEERVISEEQEIKRERSQAVAASESAAASELEELSQVASISQLAAGPGTVDVDVGAKSMNSEGGIAVITGFAEEASEPSAGTLPSEASGAVHSPKLPPSQQRSGKPVTGTEAASSQAGVGVTEMAGEDGKGLGLERYSHRRLAHGVLTEPHHVEELFNPAVEEPLIPSLALRHRRNSIEAVNDAPGTPFTAATAATAVAVAAVEPTASRMAHGVPDPRFNNPIESSEGGVEFPLLAGDRVESPKLLPRTFSLDQPGQRRGTAGTEGTLDSEPPSLSPYSMNSLPPMTPNGTHFYAVSTLEAPEDTTLMAAPAAALRPTSEGTASIRSVGTTFFSHTTQRQSGTQLKREAVAEKLDDRTYWCLSGKIVLEAVQVFTEMGSDADAEEQEISDSNPPPLPAAERSASSLRSGISQGQAQVQGQGRAQVEAQEQGSETEQVLLPRSPRMQQLQVANPGDAFSGGALMEAATAAFSAPTAAVSAASPPTPELQQQLLQVLPLGCSVLRARVPIPADGGSAAAAGGGAEVLCMSRTMFELLSNGIGRTVPPAVLPVLARHVDWLTGVDLHSLATDLSGHYRLEEHKQGTELLRAGEAAPVVFLVASGECVMRGPVVGLREPGSVADMIDLATLREGATCGELSLLAARPLWYTLVVASQSAKVVSLDMPALRSWLLNSTLGRAAAADVVASVAEVDIALYGRAVKQIAVQVMSEKLELSLFNAPMKKILLRVMEDYGPELLAVLERQREQQQQQQETKGGAKEGSPSAAGGASATAGGATAGSGGASGSAKRPRDIVLEGWSQVEAIATSLARPYDPQAQSWELIAQARYNAARRNHTLYLDSLLASSQLTTQEDTRGHASGDQRIAMPAPGLVAEAMAEPGPVRQAKLYDIRTVPKDLRGSEVESSRLSWDCSYVPLHELTTMMGAQVHVKQAAALQLLQPTMGQSLQQQSEEHVENRHSKSHRQGPPEPSLPQPAGTRAITGASNYLLAHRKGNKEGGCGGDGDGGEATTAGNAAAARQCSGDVRHAGGSSSATTPSNRTSVGMIVPIAPWDTKGRLPRGRGMYGGEDGTPRSSSSPSRFAGYRDKAAPSPSSWSMAPLETLAGRLTDNLSHAASCSSLALMDPDQRIQLDLEISSDEPNSPQRGYRDAAVAAVAAAATAVSEATVGIQRPLPSCEAPSGIHKALDSIPEERSGLPSMIPSEDLSISPRPLQSRTLPPLPPPHDTVSRLAVRQSIPVPVGALATANPTETAVEAAPLGLGAAAAATPQGKIARRSRIQPRASSTPSVDPLDDPARSFWVRDKLHDPQGLAETIMADAAACAVGQTMAAAAAANAACSATALRPDKIAASATGNASANVLMAAGGRTGLPSGSRSTRLQPLRRNGASVGAPGPGGAAAAAAAAAAGAARGSSAEGSPRGAFAHGSGSSGGVAAAKTASAPPTPPPIDSDMLYVTLQLPEAPKILPEFPSPVAIREAAEAAAAAEKAAREARIAASIAHHSTRPLCIRPDMKYVPQYLRQRQRAPVIPAPVMPLPDGTSESWVVPSYSSEVGFQDGFYDENSQVIYFD